MGKIVDKIIKIAEPIADSRGLNLVDVDFVKEGSDWVLRVFIENPTGEVNLEHCEDVSKGLSAKLDLENPIEQTYILEVSSPGLERPLKKKADFDRFKDELVIIKTYIPIDGNKEFIGILLGREGEDILIQKKGEKGLFKIPFARIASAHLTFDFNYYG